MLLLLLVLLLVCTYTGNTAIAELYRKLATTPIVMAILVFFDNMYSVYTYIHSLCFIQVLGRHASQVSFINQFELRDHMYYHMKATRHLLRYL